MLVLVKLQASAANFAKCSTPPYVFFTFFKLQKLYQTLCKASYIEICSSVNDMLSSINYDIMITGLEWFDKNISIIQSTGKHSNKGERGHEIARPSMSMSLTHSWQWSLLYGNQSSNLLCKSMGWFAYDEDLRHERVKLVG